MKVSIPKTESITNRMMLAVDKMNRISARWLTSDEQQLCNRAIEQSSKNADAGTLWILYTDYGFTAEQLIEFVKKYREKYMYLESNFQASIEDIPEVQSLKDIGVDLEAIYKGDA
jgi:hypothetical protein